MLLAYAKAAGLAVDSADPGRMPIQVPGEDGQTREKSFARCGMKELRQALRTQQALRPGTALPGR
jgi:hypothetical protein